MAPCFAFTADQPASWQTVHCDTSVGGTGSPHADSSTCPAGDTWGRYHGDFSCPTSRCALLLKTVTDSVCHLHFHVSFRVQTASDYSNALTEGTQSIFMT